MRPQIRSAISFGLFFLLGVGAALLQALMIGDWTGNSQRIACLHVIMVAVLFLVVYAVYPLVLRYPRLTWLGPLLLTLINWGMVMAARTAGIPRIWR